MLDSSGDRVPACDIKQDRGIDVSQQKVVVDVFMHSHHLDQALSPSIIRGLSVLKLAYRNHAEVDHHACCKHSYLT